MKDLHIWIPWLVGMVLVGSMGEKITSILALTGSPTLVGILSVCIYGPTLFWPSLALAFREGRRGAGERENPEIELGDDEINLSDD